MLQFPQSQTECDRFFELSLDMLCIANFEGYFMQLNPAWTQILGYTQAELLASPYLDLFIPTIAAGRWQRLKILQLTKIRSNLAHPS
jgi:PAS domain S-box-containing protein